MTYTEQAALLGSARGLVTIIGEPRSTAGAPGHRIAAVFLNAGVIHRVGPSRLYVHMARELASRGWVTARFDHAGIGDSPARKDGMSFEQSARAEAREVMDALEQSRGIGRFVLVGLCSGAVTSFECAGVDPRVVGIVMINPQGFDNSPEWNAYVLNRTQARKYWRESLFSLRSWKNALTGRVDYARLRSVLWRQAAATVASEPHSAVSSVATKVAQGLERLAQRDVRTILVCSEGDDGIEYMNVILGRDLRKVRAVSALEIEILPGADHSLTLLDSQKRVMEIVSRWAAEFEGTLKDRAPSSEPAADAGSSDDSEASYVSHTI